MHKPQAGFDPPPIDDTSYEADALPTKPPLLGNKGGYKMNFYFKQQA